MKYIYVIFFIFQIQQFLSCIGSFHNSCDWKPCILSNSTWAAWMFWGVDNYRSRYSGSLLDHSPALQLPEVSSCDWGHWANYLKVATTTIIKLHICSNKAICIMGHWSRIKVFVKLLKKLTEEGQKGIINSKWVKTSSK